MRKSRNLEKRRHGLQMVTLCISTTMVLTLLGLVMLSVLTAHNLQKNLRENVEISVILGDTIAKEDGVALGKMIQKKSYAHQVAFISSEEALKMAKDEMGIDPTEFTGSNPFSPELTVTMEAEYANTDSLSVIVKRLLKDRRVVDVAYTKDEIDGMNRILEPVSIALLGLSVLLIFICYTLISNSIQLSIYSRRFLIHTMKLVGASWGFIRRPFIWRAIAIGLVAAIIAILVLGGGVYAWYTKSPDILIVMTWEVLAITAGVILLFGLIITTFCSYVSVNKFLKMKAGDLYKV
jgi:cell division transport system permease protein